MTRGKNCRIIPPCRSAQYVAPPPEPDYDCNSCRDRGVARGIIGGVAFGWWCTDCPRGPEARDRERAQAKAAVASA